MKSDGPVRDVVVDRLHPLPGQRAGVLDRLLADLAEPRVHGRVVRVRGLAVQHAARAVLRAERRVLRVVAAAPALPRRSGGRGCRRTRRTRGPSAGTRSGRRGGSCRTGRSRSPSGLSSSAIVGSSFCSPSVAPGRPTLVRPVRRPCWPVMNDARPAVQLCSRVVVGEDHALLGDAVDVRRAVAHQPVRVGADVRLADVVAPDDDDVRLRCGGLGTRGSREGERTGRDEERKEGPAHSMLLGGAGTPSLASGAGHCQCRSGMPRIPSRAWTSSRRHLEHLIAVASQRGFTRAAEVLGVTQPALSRSIQELERLVGLRLFDRLSQGVVPTAAGERLLRHAREVLAGFEALERDAAEARIPRRRGSGDRARTGGRRRQRRRRDRPTRGDPPGAPLPGGDRPDPRARPAAPPPRARLLRRRPELPRRAERFPGARDPRAGRRPLLQGRSPDPRCARSLARACRATRSRPSARRRPASSELRSILREAGAPIDADWQPRLWLSHSSPLGALLLASDTIGATVPYPHVREIRAGLLRSIPAPRAVYRGRVGPVRLQEPPALPRSGGALGGDRPGPAPGPGARRTCPRAERRARRDARVARAARTHDDVAGRPAEEAARHLALGNRQSGGRIRRLTGPAR